MGFQNGRIPQVLGKTQQSLSELQGRITEEVVDTQKLGEGSRVGIVGLAGEYRQALVILKMALHAPAVPSSARLNYP